MKSALNVRLFFFVIFYLHSFILLPYCCVQFSVRITESASGATALATGYLTNNEVVSLDVNGNQLRTILEYAQDLDMSVGLISTKYIADSTTGVFAAHVEHSSMRTEIAYDLLDNLSDMFRSALNSDTFVSLDDELEMVKSYLSIEQARLGEKITLDKQKRLIQKFLSGDPKVKLPAKIWAEQENGTRLLVPYDEISYVDAKDKGVFINTKSGKRWRTRYTLKKLETRLVDSGFYRTHKSFLVNIQDIEEVIPWFSGGYQIRLRNEDSSTLPVSRRYATRLKKLLHWN